MEIVVNNVNEALSDALFNFAVDGQTEDTRNGKCLVYPEPVLTVYHQPQERVLFSPRRNANPWFHLFESLWMLAGRNDVQWITHYNSQFRQFSDDGITFHGAYGYRWQIHFGYDQLRYIAEELKRNPNSRRAVLTMWDGRDDLNYAMGCPALGRAAGKDAPCNTHAYFDCRNGVLNLTVCCRSNDVWWGAYGSNAVHFSMLQEVMAAWVGIPVGVYRQFSNNLHIYYETVPEANDPNLLREMAFEVKANDAYAARHPTPPYPIVGHTPIAIWFDDLRQFMQNPLVSDRFTWRSNFFKNVAVPMAEAWDVRKRQQGTGLQQADNIQALDWRKACIDWIERREVERIDKLQANA